MIDGVPKATGNAYLAKASLPSTYADFKAAIEAGTQGLDLNFNAAGWAVVGTLLSKAKLLPDTVRDALGLTGDASPADALGALVPALSRAKIAYGSYIGTGTYGESSKTKITFPFPPKFVVVRAKGGLSNIIAIYPAKSHMYAEGNGILRLINLIWNEAENSLSYYGDTTSIQMNSSGEPYYYIALG